MGNHFLLSEAEPTVRFKIEFFFCLLKKGVNKILY